MARENKLDPWKNPYQFGQNFVLKINMQMCIYFIYDAYSLDITDIGDRALVSVIAVLY